MAKMKQYRLEPGSYWNRRNTPRGFVDDCSHAGQVDRDIERWKVRFYIHSIGDYNQLYDRIKSYGIEMEETYDFVIKYTIWLMACDINEEGNCCLCW